MNSHSETVQVSGVQIPLGSHLSPKMQEVIRAGNYETYELELVKEHLTKDDVVMELGAGLGLLSAYCAMKIGSERVFAYEGNPALEKPIRELYRINNVNPSLKIGLVGHKSGSSEFHVNEDFWESSAVRKAQGSKTETVPNILFNEEVKRVRPTFLLVDIEGSEYELFEKANLDGIKKIAIEMHDFIGPKKGRAVLKRLQKAGFAFIKPERTRNRKIYDQAMDTLGPETVAALIKSANAVGLQLVAPVAFEQYVYFERV